MIEIEAPDGSIVEFPAGTSDDTIKAVMRKNYGQPVQAQANLPQGNLTNQIGAGVQGLAQGLTFGLSDEIEAGIKSGGLRIGPLKANIWGDYDQELANVRERMAENSRAAPVTEIAGNLAGGVGTGIGIAKNVGTMIGKGIVPTMAEGALYGGAYGLGTGEDTQGRLQNALTGAVTGGVTAGVMDKVGRAIFKPKAPNVATSTVDDIASQADDLYTRARQSGLAIRPQAFDRLKQNMRLAAGRVNANLRRNTAGVLDDLDNMNGPIDLQDFDELRQQVGAAMKRAEPQDRRALQLMKNQLDAFADNIKPGDATGPLQAMDMLKDARGLWARKAKYETIRELMENADLDTSMYTQSGVANTITREFRKLSKNRKAMKQFSVAEQEAIKDIARGRYSPAAVRWLAKFAPRGVVSTILGMSPSLVNPAALALPLAGHVAGRSVDNAAMQAAQRVQGGVLAGGFAPLPARANPFGPVIPAASGQPILQLDRMQRAQNMR